MNELQKKTRPCHIPYKLQERGLCNKYIQCCIINAISYKYIQTKMYITIACVYTVHEHVIIQPKEILITESNFTYKELMQST